MTDHLHDEIAALRRALKKSNEELELTRGYLAQSQATNGLLRRDVEELQRKVETLGENVKLRDRLLERRS